MDWNAVLTSGINIPGLSSVSDILTWGITIGALFALGAIVYAGIRYAASVDSPSLKEDAKDRIRQAIYGLLLLLAAYLILFAINPEILGH